MGGCGPNQKVDGFTVATPDLLKKSLARRLVTVVDKVRDIATQLGARPYRVRMMRTRSTGHERGDGVETVVAEFELLPTPKVIDLNTLAEVVTPMGPTEIGLVQLQQVSGRYTEEFLSGLDPDGNPPADSDNLFYEIEFFRPDGRPADKHRFALASAPYYHATKVQWSITLDAQIAKRRRDGRVKP